MRERLKSLIDLCEGFHTIHWDDFERFCDRLGVEAESKEVTDAMVWAGFSYSPSEDILIAS